MRKVRAEQVGTLFVLSTSLSSHRNAQIIVLQRTDFPPACLCPCLHAAHPSLEKSMVFPCTDCLHLLACRAHPRPSRTEQKLDLPQPRCRVLSLGLWLMHGLTAVSYLDGLPTFKDGRANTVWDSVTQLHCLLDLPEPPSLQHVGPIPTAGFSQAPWGTLSKQSITRALLH